MLNLLCLDQQQEEKGQRGEAAQLCGRHPHRCWWHRGEDRSEPELFWQQQQRRFDFRFEVYSIRRAEVLILAAVTSPLLPPFFPSDSNLRLFVSKDGTTALSGTQLANRYAAVYYLYSWSFSNCWPIQCLIYMIMCFCAFPRVTPGVFEAVVIETHWDMHRFISSLVDWFMILWHLIVHECVCACMCIPVFSAHCLI